MVPDIPGLDATQKELLNMVAAVQPEITAQLAASGPTSAPGPPFKPPGPLLTSPAFPPVSMLRWVKDVMYQLPSPVNLAKHQ